MPFGLHSAAVATEESIAPADHGAVAAPRGEGTQGGAELLLFWEALLDSAATLNLLPQNRTAYSPTVPGHPSEPTADCKNRKILSSAILPDPHGIYRKPGR